jgi:rubrerythrin
VFLGHNPPPLDSLGDVSDKQLTERIEAVTDWLESLRAWIQDTVSHGDILFEALKDAAEEYYQRWLNLTADPFRLSEINLESILDGSDTLDLQYYDEFLLRSFGKISKALPKRLSSELKKDIAANKLTAFQKVASILAIVLTNFSVTNLKEHTALFGALHQPSQWLYGTHIKDGPTGYVSLVSYIQALEFAKRLPRVSQLDIGRLTTGVTTLVTEMMSLLDGLQRDELSARARQNGLFVYGCKLDSLIAIIKMCRDVARVSASFKKNFKERSDKKDKDKKEREKREETNKRKRGNLAKATPEQSPSEHPVNTDQPTPSTAHQAKAKGKGQKGAKRTKGSGKNDEQKQTEQGTTGKGQAQGESNQDTRKPSPKLCSVCGKTLAEHPDKKWCVPLCYECKKPLDAHPNRRWCPRTKNGQSPSAPAGSPTPP